MSHSKVGQDFPRPDLHFDGHAAYSATMANGIEALEVFKQFDMDQRSGNFKEIVAAFNLAGSTEVEFHCKSTCLSFPCQFLRRKREVVNKFCFVVWVWVRGVTRQSSTRLLVS